MPDIAYPIALCVLGFAAWDAWRRHLQVVTKKWAINDRIDSLEKDAKAEIKMLHTRMDVVHGDVVNLGDMTKKEFQRLSGKQSMQTMGAEMFQPQTGLKPF